MGNFAESYTIRHLRYILRSAAVVRFGKTTLLSEIIHSNTHTWHHINLQGEHDFSEDSPVTVLFDSEQALSAVSLTA